MIHPKPNRAACALGVVVLAAALSACGGGSTSSAVVTPPVSTTTPVPVTVVDGPINGAVVCLDKNGNGVCDAGEPSGTTDTSGHATLTVDNGDVGLYPVVVMVGTDAVDADTGAVPVPFVMQAPADQTAVVSPLTTLVQLQMATSGGTSEDAATIVQAQTGVNVSLFGDYTISKSTSADAAFAANVARLVVMATQQQLTTLASTVGQTDVSGATVTQADLQGAVVKSLLGSLPALAVAAADPGVASAATPAARDAALTTLLSSLVANGQAGLNASTLLAAVGSAKESPDTSTSSPVAGATLRALTFTDANNWFFRAMEATAADNTPDANGFVRYYDNRTQDTAGTTVTWGYNNIARLGDLHWNGSVWVGCPVGLRSTQGPRDGNGISHYNYCDTLEQGVSQRFGVGIAGKTLSEVVGTIRAFPGIDSGVAYTSFGPSDMTLLGSATFPAGSNLWYYFNQVLSTAIGYDVQDTAVIKGYSAAIAAGGTATASPPPACAVVTSNNNATYFLPVATLEDLIATKLGKPCVYGPTTGGLALSNEWWGNSVTGLGSLAGAITPPSATFDSAELLELAFGPSGNAVTYLSCLRRASDGSVRNCTAIGTGTYAIQTLGDARIMTFGNAPLEVLRLGYARVFVERGGQIHAGYQTIPGTKTNTVRMNLSAANALFAQLGMPPIVPN